MYVLTPVYAFFPLRHVIIDSRHSKIYLNFVCWHTYHTHYSDVTWCSWRLKLSVALDENIVSVTDAIHKYKGHPSVEQIKKHYSDDIRNFYFQSVDADSLMLMIKKHDSKKAIGYDNIPGKVIKIAHQELANPLCNLINHSMKMKCFPSIMKFAEVTPVYRKENNLKRDNYRPLSIVTVITKLYENVLNTQMVNHFYVMFNELLAAFRKFYSCQTLLIKFIKNLKSALDKGHKIGNVYMDLSKAFDCLSHGLLIAKLHANSLSEAACETMLDYLKGRKQWVKI